MIKYNVRQANGQSNYFASLISPLFKIVFNQQSTFILFTGFFLPEKSLKKTHILNIYYVALWINRVSSKILMVAETADFMKQQKSTIDFKKDNGTANLPRIFYVQ